MYNPSFRRGGKLKIIYLKKWHEIGGYTPKWPKHTKHERRKNFDGLTLKGVLTVNCFSICSVVYILYITHDYCVTNCYNGRGEGSEVFYVDDALF